MSARQQWWRRLGGSLATALALFAAFPTLSPAQLPVTYGDPARTGTIVNPGEKHRFLLLGAQAGDTLRITFASRYTGGCCGYFVHRIDVMQGTTTIGTIEQRGTLTLTLPTTGFYTLEVRARNNQDTGWYAFQLDRLNNPVGADRIAFNWNMRDSISTAAQFAVYTLRATAGSSGLLRFTSQYSGGCCGYNYHYAELLDATGQQLAVVQGDGSAPVTFDSDGVYTLFVAARNWEDIGWYSATVDCQSWPAVPCDCVAHSSNYGQGLRGTQSVPSLTASAPPRLGSTPAIQIGNSYGQPTNAFLLVGLTAGNTPLPFYGGTLLVDQPVVWPVPVAATGQALGFPIPNNPLLCGIGVAMQSVLYDPGAQPASIAFSPGLLVLLGR